MWTQRRGNPSLASQRTLQHEERTASCVVSPQFELFVLERQDSQTEHLHCCVLMSNYYDSQRRCHRQMIRVFATAVKEQSSGDECRFDHLFLYLQQCYFKCLITSTCSHHFETYVSYRYQMIYKFKYFSK